MDGDGNNQLNITDHPANDRNPSWSPDGQSIAFVSNRDGNDEIYVMTPLGNNQRRLTNNPVFDRAPAWFSTAKYPVSPAGKLRATWGWLKQKSE